MPSPAALAYVQGCGRLCGTRRRDGGGAAAGAAGGDAALGGETAAAADDLARVERAVAATATRYMGDLRVMLGELREVYEGRIRAGDALAAELRRRAEGADAEVAALRARLAAQDGPHAAVASAPVPTTSRRRGASGRA
ncbi:MAG TPA: hypothetical protein VFL91_03600 [Thermomicrobiales bacterium]|nr:hypothetical protein [Thermomicrobiales bacterium]